MHSCSSVVAHRSSSEPPARAASARGRHGSAQKAVAGCCSGCEGGAGASADAASDGAEGVDRTGARVCRTAGGSVGRCRVNARDLRPAKEREALDTASEKHVERRWHCPMPPAGINRVYPGPTAARRTACSWPSSSTRQSKCVSNQARSAWVQPASGAGASGSQR